MLSCGTVSCIIFFFKQKTAYEMRISDWSSDVCSSDLCLTAHWWQNFSILDKLLDPTYSLLHTICCSSTTATEKSTGSQQNMSFTICRVLGTWQFDKIGRASCRERVCQYVYISVVAVSLKKKSII